MDMETRDDNEQHPSTEPLARTVNNLKETTTTIRGFADNLDQLLSAVEGFFPFIEKASEKTELLSKTFMPRNRNFRRNQPFRRRKM